MLLVIRLSSDALNRLQIKEEKDWLKTVTPAFQYRSHSELSAARYMSKTSTYLFDGSGYAHDFDVKNLQEFDNITRLLQDYAWIDAGTRLIMLEISLYSPATDLVTSAFFMVQLSSQIHLFQSETDCSSQNLLQKRLYCTVSQSLSTLGSKVFIMSKVLSPEPARHIVQVEVQGSGYAQSRVGYEAFRLHYYKTNRLSWGRLAVELLFVILSATSFAGDLSPIIFRRNAYVKQDQHWARCAPTTWN